MNNYICMQFSLLFLNPVSNRFEAFNSLIRTQNIYGNRQSPSRDIARRFLTLEYLRFICSGGLYDTPSMTRYI